MEKWIKQLKYDPIKPLVLADDLAISQTTKKYILEENVNLEELWDLPEPTKLLSKQNSAGYWIYQNPPDNNVDYDQYQTYLNLTTLVEKYGLNNKHEKIKKACEYLLSFQTKEGDLRGIYGKQYTPNYTAAIIETLIKSGFGKDTRIKKALDWLYSVRQNDSGWALPFRTKGHTLDAIYFRKKTILPDKSKPSSHMVTGVVLRAFAVDSEYKNNQSIQEAGQLLSNRLFLKDKYPDRGEADYWFRFGFPFIYTDLLSTLDSLTLLNFTPRVENINKAFKWFKDNQNKDGTWEIRITRGRNKQLTKFWLSLAITRVFKRSYE